jgi:2-polyprenyl-6-methoxyphenol hydroxylase-like FAD-dependent oxidoreductase
MARAIVVGASMSGLLAARVLAERFESVVIVDRDRLPADATYRAGVPQSRHLHAILARGQRVLEDLFPGFRDDLIARGAELVEWPTDLLWLSTVGWARRFRPGLALLFASRELIEWRVRERVLSRPQVTVLEAHEVVRLEADARRARVTGVGLRSRDGNATETTLEGDLVVDASGRDSHAPQWLAALGYAAPQQTTVNAFLGYASRYYRRPTRRLDWKAIVLGTTTEIPRGAALFPIEGGRWLVTLAGMGGEYPPTDEAGFLAFARSLRSPVLADAIAEAEPLGPIHGYRRTENQLRHYERVRLPMRFVLVGDAVAAFNPIYGQGMTVAAQDALALDEALRRGDLDTVGASVQRGLASLVATPWLLATSEDFRYRTTVGERPSALVRSMHGYVLRLQQLTTEDPLICRTFLDVAHLLRPPRALFSPAILARALRPSAPHALAEPPTDTLPHAVAAG